MTVVDLWCQPYCADTDHTSLQPILYQQILNIWFRDCTTFPCFLHFESSCCYCRAQWVPSLSISILDCRDQALQSRIVQSPSTESVQSIQSAPFLKANENAQLSNDDEPGAGQRSTPSIDTLSLGSEGDLLSSKGQEEKADEETTKEEQTELDTVGPLLNLSGSDSKDEKIGDSRRSRSSSESGTGEIRRGSMPDRKNPSRFVSYVLLLVGSCHFILMCLLPDVSRGTPVVIFKGFSFIPLIHETVIMERIGQMHDHAFLGQVAFFDVYCNIF